MDTKKLNALIATIARNSKAQREQIQQALIGCALQCFEHGSNATSNKLFEAVGNGVRKEGMLKWLSIYAPVHFAGGEVLVSKKRRAEMAATTTVEEYAAKLAEAPAWHALAEPQKIANPWDSVKFAETLALHLEQAAKKADKAGDSALSELIKDAEMLFRVRLNAAAYDVVEVD